MVAVNPVRKLGMNIAAGLLDPDYASGLDGYDAAYQSVTHEVWEDYYLHGSRANSGSVNPLPDVSYLPVDAAANHEAAHSGPEKSSDCLSQASAATVSR